MIQKIKEDKMIFRELNNKLYKITLPVSITEDEFLEKQKDGSVNFIKIDPESLPVIPDDEQRHFSEIFYMFDNNENIVIDYERTVEEWINEKYSQTKNHIYKYYSQIKQASDQADKEYYSTLLKANGVQNLEATIASIVSKYYDGQTIDEVLNTIEDLTDDTREAYLQLLKVGIRVTWVQRCKSELKKAIEENREPIYPEYPL